MNSHYGVTAEDYLDRAISLINTGDRGCLIYAALELRAGIESRMQEYLEAQEHISQKKKKGWQIAKLGKNIEEAFKLGNKVAKIQVFEHDGLAPIAILYYTPVTSTLRKEAEKLGEYLHALSLKKVSNDEWWGNLRILLDNISGHLREATSGVLLGPPMLQKSTGKSNVSISGLSEKEHKYLLSKLGKNQEIIIKVDYLPHLPKDARSCVFVPKS